MSGHKNALTTFHSTVSKNVRHQHMATTHAHQTNKSLASIYTTNCFDLKYMAQIFLDNIHEVVEELFCQGRMGDRGVGGKNVLG